MATLHRAENTDDVERLISIFSALNTIAQEIPIVLPLHPRTRKILEKINIEINYNIYLVEPVSFLEMLWLEKNSILIMTDSGGVQKEAFFNQKPCVTLRDETEWVELVENGYNKLVGADRDKILLAVNEMINKKIDFSHDIYGNGHAAEIIVDAILESL